MTRLILIRHGETSWNQEARFQGQEDIPLSATGQGQALALAKRFAGSDSPLPDAIYSSDLVRCLQTAEPTARKLRLPVQVDPRLREINGGAWQGLFPQEIEEQFPGERQAWQSDPLHTCCPGGESYHALQGRAVAAIEEISVRHSGQTLVVFTHGGTVKALLGHVERSPSWWWNKLVKNCSLSVVEFHNGQWVLIRAGDTTHLEL